MKKIAAALLALAMLLAASAFAQGINWENLDILDINISFPEGITCDISDEAAPFVPFITFYDNYDPDAAYNNNLAISCGNRCWDIYRSDPYDYAKTYAKDDYQRLASTGVKVEPPVIINAALGLQDGRDALFMMYSMKVDYSGLNEAVDMYTIRMVVPHAESASTYIITLITDNVDTSGILMLISDSIRWR